MIHEKPKITLPITRLDWATEFIAGTILLLTFVILSVYFKDLPDRVPRHFNATGVADGFGGKNMILILPLINLIVFAVLTWAQRVPHIHNFPVSITAGNIVRQYQNSVSLLRTVKVIITIQFFYITYATIETAFGRMNGLSPFFVPVSIGVLLISIIFHVTRSYRLR
jgi:uncharacterized membrane protein